MMTFWDTIRGNQLADTLIRYLPTLCDSIENEKRKHTEIIKLYDTADDETVAKLITKEHYSLEGSFIDSKGITNIVLKGKGGCING